MVFSSYVFLFLFLPILFIGYYAIPQKYRGARNIQLLVFSVIFYGYGGPKYLLLLSASILINWFGGVLIYHFREGKYLTIKKTVVFSVVVTNIILFGVFKYTDFVINNINILFSTSIPLQNIVLPIGISFYTFQGMSYVFDVYRNPSIYLKNPLTVALYISLFPQLVAGPIVRFADVAEDIKNRKESLNLIVEGIQRFILGLAKKIILADTFGIIANSAFASSNLTTGMAWIGALAYTLQIYFDFSGYSDMAIGLGKIFGFKFCENFNYPYISKSVTEFWRRWHISLSSWFRDYIYIPLGGNRCSKMHQIFNMSVVWILTGLWHGASWNFVLWGVYYLAWLILEKFFFKLYLDKIPGVIRRIITLLIIVFGWVLFRAENMSIAWLYIRAMFGFSVAGFGVIDFWVNLTNYIAFWIVGIIAATPIPKQLVNKLSIKYETSSIFLSIKMSYILIIFLVCAIYVLASSYNAFIYFQF